MTLFYHPHQTGAWSHLSPRPMHELRKALAARRGCRTNELPDHILEAFEDIEAGRGRYLWAFEDATDAKRLSVLSQSSLYRSYPQPQKIEELTSNFLLECFPSQCRLVSTVEGGEICHHPYLGPGPSPGSVQTEVPRLLPRERWEQLSGFGERGVALVKLTSPEL